jgi:hypothetical protein
MGACKDGSVFIEIPKILIIIIKQTNNLFKFIPKRFLNLKIVTFWPNIPKSQSFRYSVRVCLFACLFVFPSFFPSIFPSLFCLSNFLPKLSYVCAIDNFRRRPHSFFVTGPNCIKQVLFLSSVRQTPKLVLAPAPNVVLC